MKKEVKNMEKEKKPMSIKKKILIIILVLIAVYVLTTIPYRIIKANKLFGDEKCSLVTNPPTKQDLMFGYGDKDHPTMGGTAITGWRCSVCGWYSRAATTATPELCELCAKITGRCETCGKLLK